MAEDVIAAIIVLGFFAAIFMPLGIIPLAHYFRLTHGLTVTAAVEEHVYSPSRKNKKTWLLKLKYYANGLEYINTYNVCKKRDYLDAHPVGSKITILVDVGKPKRFIMPEDRWILLIMGGMFTLGGAASLIAMIGFLIK